MAQQTWGLGIEHEMQFAVQTDAKTVIVDSGQVVKDIGNKMRSKYAKQIVSIAPGLKQNLIAALDTSQDFRITLKLLSSLIPPKLENASDIVSKLSRDEACYLLEHIIGTPNGLVENIYLNHVECLATPFQERFYDIWSKAWKPISKTNVKSHLIKVLKSGRQPVFDEFCKFLDTCVDTIDDSHRGGGHRRHKNTPQALCLGDIIVMTNGKVKMIHMNRGRAVTTTELATILLWIVSAMRPYESTIIPTAFEKDADFVETKTTEFKNVRIERCIEELQSNEKLALVSAKNINKNAVLLPYSGYNDVFDGDMQQKWYTGSYHFWWTLPHSPWRITDQDAYAKHSDFVRAHSQFAYGLQWIEPLLIALTTCDPEAIGNGTKFPRAYMRGTLNKYAGLGTVDTCLDMSVTNVVKDRMPYFQDEKSLEEAIKTGRWTNQAYTDADVPSKLYFSIDGKKLVPMLSASQMGRRTSDFQLLERIVRPLLIQQSYHPINFKFVHQKRNYKLSGHGTNVRFEWSQNVELQLKRNWYPFLVKRDDKLVIYFVHISMRKYTLRMPVRHSVSKHVRATGFEFRIMDNFPSKQLPAFMHILALIAAASQRVTCGQPVKFDNTWLEALDSVLTGGSLAVVPKAYLVNVYRVLNLKYDLPDSEVTYFDALIGLCRSLFHSYNTHSWMKLWYGKSIPIHPPVPYDLNLEAWQFFFERHHAGKIDEKRKEALRRAVERNANDQTIARLLGGKTWILDVPYARIFFRKKRNAKKP